MSANNHILILWDKDEKKYLVDERDMEENAIIQSIGEASILEEAVDIANEYMTDEYMQGHEVEYGLSIVTRNSAERKTIT